MVIINTTNDNHTNYSNIDITNTCINMIQSYNAIFTLINH